MNHRKCPTLFFAGTDTEVGKTWVASLAAGALRSQCQNLGVYKPVASGCLEQDGRWVAQDAVQLWQAAGKPGSLDEVCPQRFEAPLAPPEAARQEGKQVDVEQLVTGADVWRNRCDRLIVEGAGGLFSPLADNFLNVDLALKLADVRVVIVAADRLGVIHQVLACCQAAAHRGIMVSGVILNQVDAQPDASIHSNLQQLRQYSDAPILGPVRHGMKRLPDSITQHLLA